MTGAFDLDARRGEHDGNRMRLAQRIQQRFLGLLIALRLHRFDEAVLDGVVFRIASLDFLVLIVKQLGIGVGNLLLRKCFFR